MAGPNSQTGHVCDWTSAWPTGHPLPPEEPSKLTGPEVGTFVMYQPAPLRSGKHVDGELVWTETVRPAIVVEVLRRSYVWSPGECRSHGGYRRYDWTVIAEGPGEYRSVVVDDHQLSDLPANGRVTYGLAIRG